MDDEIVWTWCPECGERQDHVRNADGTLTCMECGRQLPQDCAVNRDSHSNPDSPGGVGGLEGYQKGKRDIA